MFLTLGSSMRAEDRDRKARAKSYPQEVPWSDTNEVRRQKRRNLEAKCVITEDQGIKDRNMVSSSRVQAAGAPPVRNGAPSSSRQVHVARNSSRQGLSTDEIVPGAVVVDEDDHPITARVVDPEEERRVLREQVQQVLQEERAHHQVAVVHAAASDMSSSSESSYEDMEHGNVAVVHASAKNSHRHVGPGRPRVVNDTSSSEDSYEVMDRGNVAVVHAATKNYDRHVVRGRPTVVDDASSSDASYEDMERGNVAVAHVAAKNYDRHVVHGKAAHAAHKKTETDMERGNSNVNRIEQNPVFNIQVPVTTSVEQTSG